MSARRLENFPAIATAYRQYEFRSRLEAKWAVFFDLCGWSWSYEPLDMNGWIPDFAIGERPVLVEIKPFFREEEYADAKQKIIHSGCHQDVILLGADPAWMSVEYRACGGEAPGVGWLFEPCRQGFEDFAPPTDAPVEWMTHDLHFGLTEGNNKPGLCTMDMAWVNQIWKAPNVGHANKWSRVWLQGADVEEHLVNSWAKACNVSKWIPHAQRV